MAQIHGCDSVSAAASCLITLMAASSGKRNVTVWRPSVCLYVPSFSDLDERGAHT